MNYDEIAKALEEEKRLNDELGKIEVMDYCAFVAVARNKADDLVANLRKEKIKRKSFKISVSR